MFIHLPTAVVCCRNVLLSPLMRRDQTTSASVCILGGKWAVNMTVDCASSSCRLYVQWRFRAGVEKQFLTLQKGFHELIPPHLLKMFDEKELELVISGLGKVDVEDWKNNTRLKHCSPDSDIVKWFWKVGCK